MRGSHRLLIALAALAILVWCAAPVHAQSTAKLQGTVTDAQNAARTSANIRGR